LGPLVARAGLRNPALLAKHVATLDTATGGRVELGLGAGATRDEALAFGYPFPTLEKRFEQLRDTLAIVRPLLAAGRVAYRGSWARAEGAIVNPRGTGTCHPDHRRRQLTATIRLAVGFADELNLVVLAARRRGAIAATRTCADSPFRDPRGFGASTPTLEAPARRETARGLRDLGVSR
jgi:alkanesulfonate monooxygenase SsuD/methylene tetrahydromethanopterin reductase-like flavin-dependent oxidoreductase (luciferase family)